jgi:hypothetical protein
MRESQSNARRERKYTVRVDNVYFLSRIGLSLRWATRDIAREELPADIRRLLAQLDRLQAEENARQDAAETAARQDEPAI